MMKIQMNMSALITVGDEMNNASHFSELPFHSTSAKCHIITATILLSNAEYAYISPLGARIHIIKRWNRSPNLAYTLYIISHTFSKYQGT